MAIPYWPRTAAALPALTSNPHLEITIAATSSATRSKLRGMMDRAGCLAPVTRIREYEAGQREREREGLSGCLLPSQRPKYYYEKIQEVHRTRGGTGHGDGLDSRCRTGRRTEMQNFRRSWPTYSSSPREAFGTEEAREK